MPRKKTRPNVIVSSSQHAMRVPRKRLTELVGFLAAVEGVRIAEVDIAVVSRDEISRHNRRWLGEAGATDVISFDLSDDSAVGISAQIIVCGDVAARQAKRQGVTPQRELMLYVVHGLLHLVGYDDRPIRAAAKMHAREEEILEAFLMHK